MKKQVKCRICKSKNLKTIIDLGSQPLANSFLTKSELNKKEATYPLKVLFCKDCNLCQLSYVVKPSVLFKKYVYFSSNMPALPEHFANYAKEVVKNFIKNKNELVVEIGSNDGLLIGAVQDMGIKILGIDPAVNIAKIANSRGIKTLPKFFSEKLARLVLKKFGNAKIIIGNNVVAHIDDHHDLVKAIKTLLSKDGVFIFEAPYLVDMFENLSFDTIYHEHLSYLALRPLSKLFKQYDMEIFDAKIFPVQGNSLRTYVGFKRMHKISSNVQKLIKDEKKLGLDKLESYLKLASKISQIKEDVVKTLKKLKKRGKSIVGYGAPAKGNTLLNYYGIGPNLLDYLTEELPSKINLYSPGMHLKVMDIKYAKQNPPNYFFLLAWNYKNAILEKEKDFAKKGGKFIMPIGKKRII